MKKHGFAEALTEVVAEDPRYDVQAYFFLREALDATSKLFAKPAEGPGRHVSGTELLEGIRQYGLQEFGPLALTVLNHWGIRETIDFGNIVFNLVNKGILGKTDEDKREDFAGGYDFQEAFRAPFLPREQPGAVPAGPLRETQG